MISKDITESFWVKCIGYNQGFEKFFTIGKEYEVVNGCITNDNEFTYVKDNKMKVQSDPETWYLSRWYAFEVIDSNSFLDLGITFEDIINGVT